MAKVKHFVKFGFGIFLGLLFMWIAFKNVDFSQMMNSFRQIEIKYILIIIAIVIIGDVARSKRWQHLLLPIKKIHLPVLYSALLIGYTANTLMPAHLGEFFRAFVIGKKNKISSSSIFATIVTERIIDVISLLLIMGITLLIYPFPYWVQQSAYVMFAGTIGLISFLFFLKRNFRKTMVFTHFILKPFPLSLREKIDRLLSSFIKGFVGLGSWRSYLAVVFHSIIIWVTYCLVFLVGIKAFEFDLPWSAGLVLLVITTISVVVPSSPGYIGTYHWLCQLSLGLYLIPKSPALAYAFFIHGVRNVPFFFLGAFLSWKEGLKIYSMKEKSKIEHDSTNQDNLVAKLEEVT